MRRAACSSSGSNYVCENAGADRRRSPTPTCDFKSGKIILQQPVEREQMAKLLATGKTDLLDKFVSMRTRRPFKAFLAWDAEAGKVNFEFEPRASQVPAAQGAPRRKTGGDAAGGASAAKTAARPAAKKAAPAKKARGEEGGRAEGAAQDRRRPHARAPSWPR